MKKIFLVAIAALVTAFSANAQVKIESPHPDLDIKITRCAYANSTVIVDMVITNFGIEDEIFMNCFRRDSNCNIVMYDDEGNSYNNGNSKIALGFPNKGLSQYGSFIFPQDIPLKFRISLGGISANASKFSLVKIGLESEGAMGLSPDTPLMFRNLEWVK